MFQNLFNSFVQFSPVIFVSLLATLVIGGLIWLFFKFYGSGGYLIFLGWCRRTLIPWLGTVRYHITNFLRWLLRLAGRLLIFLGNLLLIAIEAIGNWRTRRQGWALRKALANQIRRGEISDLLEETFAVAAHSCANCGGKRTKPRWTPESASQALRKLEPKIGTLCKGCLLELAAAASMVSPQPNPVSVLVAPTAAPNVPAAAAVSAPQAVITAPVTPASPPAAATAQRGGPEKRGWFNRLLVFSGGALLAWIAVTAFALSFIGGGVISTVLALIFGVLAILVFKDALTH